MTTRSKKKVTPINPSLSQRRVENSWVFLIKDSLFENDSFNIVTLPHPAHGKTTKYCLDDIHKKIYEVVAFSEPYRSWFIGETVKSDGSILMATPVNPVFLVMSTVIDPIITLNEPSTQEEQVRERDTPPRRSGSRLTDYGGSTSQPQLLPRLKAQCSIQAIPLENLLSEKGFDKILDFITTLNHVADLKGPVDMRAYKYNENKTINWLEGKVRKLSNVLREKNIHVTSGTVSATFVASNISNDDIDEEFYLKFAFGIISEYLDEELATTLEKQFNFKQELIKSLGKKRNSEINESDKKRIKCETGNMECHENWLNSSNEYICKDNKLKPVTAKEKARLKAASGTKTISSFFVKK